MRKIEREVDRQLTLLRNLIRQRGYTQLDVQQALGWGRSYISQLMTKQKALRIEQLHLMLDVIGVDPAAFYGELYGTAGTTWEASPRSASAVSPISGPPPLKRAEPGFDVGEELEAMRSQLRGLADLLLSEGVVTSEAMSAALGRQDR